ncbi:hypothetical protein FOA52_011884 [Chlamydomonas sp. UWO 241]|nr:hypothetical protein FOA52_011884 [Chlamydomonas sp. UWO 241]
MLRYFDEGKRDAFFTAWQQFVPASAVSFDLLTLKLEFYLSVYFSVYPVLPSSSVLVAAHRRDAGGGAGGAGSAGEAGRAELATRMRVLKVENGE